MEKLKVAPTISLISFFAILFLLTSVGWAGQYKLTCGDQKTITKSLKKLKPGDTLFVSGTCQENLLIPEEVVNIILDGQGAATIAPVDSSQNTLNIRGRGITIKGFTIVGGYRAVALQNGGAAIISGNIIREAQTFGVQISRNSFARVLGNTIQENQEDGINVRLGASADIFDNMITENRDGINVDSSGAADVSGNHIVSNTRDGVHLRDNSHIRFSADPDNTETNVIELNGENGVNCARGGTMSGNPVDFGGGNTGGNKNIATNCIVADGVLP